jgi:hypothetical protein
MAASKLAQSPTISNKPIERRCPRCLRLGLGRIIDADLGAFVYCQNCKFFALDEPADSAQADSPECPDCGRLIEGACIDCHNK